MDPVKVGSFIRRQRAAAGMTQAELAEALGLTVQSVSRWERGAALPDTAVLLPLCAALNTTADALLRAGAEPGTEPDADAAAAAQINPPEPDRAQAAQPADDMPNREAVFADILIRALQSGRTSDPAEIDTAFRDPRLAEMVRSYLPGTQPNG